MSDQDETQVEETDDTSFVVSDKLYDRLRFVAIILLPSIGTAYFALASLLGLPAAEQVVGTITIVDTLLGVVLRSLRKAYEKSPARIDGHIVVTPNPENDGITSDLNVNLNPESIANKDEITVKVHKP